MNSQPKGRSGAPRPRGIVRRGLVGSKEETYLHSLEISIPLRGEEETWSLEESHKSNVLPEKDLGGGFRTRLEEFMGTRDEQLGFCPFPNIE